MALPKIFALAIVQCGAQDFFSENPAKRPVSGEGSRSVKEDAGE
jgi:hypothetical protein